MVARLTARDWAGLCQAQPALAALPADLREQAQEVRAAAGESVFRRGALPRRMYWVVEGEVRLLRRSRNGTEIVLQRAASGYIAEASLESSRYHCDAVAVAPSRLLAFPRGSFRQSIEDDEGFRGFWIAHLAHEVRHLRAQSERLSLRSAADRIEHFIESEGEDGKVELRHTVKAWAAELGLTHEALYRALASLRKSGRVAQTEREGVLVLALAGGRPAA